MGKWFLLALLGLPIVEIALFVEVGRAIGLWPTLGLVLLAAAAGLVLIRVQGLNTMVRLTAGLEAGGGDAEPIAHAGLTVVAGFLLLVPGFFTDALGLLLLLPPVRAALIRWGAARVTVRAAGLVRGRSAGAAQDVVDADYEVVEDPGPAARGRSGWTRAQP